MSTPTLSRCLKEWVDAYTMQLEAGFQAAMSTQVTGTVADAAKRTASDAKESGGAISSQIAANQRQIQSQVHAFNIEAYHVIRKAWNRLSVDLIATSWDLADDICFTRLDNGCIRLSQGKEVLVLQQEVAQIALVFFKWVEEASEKSDPVSYVKRVLMEQGIGPDNFEKHAGRLGIANPWAPQGLIIDPNASTTGRIIVP